jgi:putative NIF3 family GTP cyclohydrolase 1 type 2
VTLFKVDPSNNSVVINEADNNIDFRVETSAKTHAIFSDGSANQVLILSGGASSSTDQAKGNDVVFYISGSRHSRVDHDTVTRDSRSITLFGGDIIASGAIETHGGEFYVLDNVGEGTVNGVKISRPTFGSSNEVYKVVNARTDTNGFIVSSLGSSTEVFSIELDNLPLLNLSGSTLTNKHKVHVNEGGHDTDFVVSSQGKDNALVVDGNLNQVLILSGGAAASFNEASAADVSFYVSGSKGSHGSATRGTSVFGGDTYTSGSAYINTLFVENEDPTIVFREPNTATDKATIGINSSDNIQIENKSTNKHIVFKVNDGGVVREGFRIDGGVAEVVVNQGSEALVDFRVESDNKTHALFVDGGTDKVLILSGGAPTSPDEKSATDTNFFVSGTIGARGTAEKGTSVFGGDLVTSGSHNVFTGMKVEGGVTFNDAGESVDFRVESDNNANMFIVKGSTDRVGIGTVSAPQATLHLKEVAPTFRIQRSGNSNNSTVEFVGQAGAVGASMFLSSSSNDLVLSTHDGVDQEEILRLGGHQAADVRQVILLSGSAMAPSAMQPKESADINFFVSGAIGSAETALRGTSVFGGDVVTSGSFRTKGAVRRATRLKNSDFNVKPTDHFLFFNTNSGHVTASLESAAVAGAGRVLVFKDVKGFADNNYIVIKPNGSDEIEGINDETKIKVASGSLSLVCDGTSRYFIFGERD